MQPDQRYALLRPCWEDLWTARDGGGYPEAAPSHSSHAQVENSTASQPGDAVLLAQGRMGPVYRRTLQGFDAVVKTLSLNVALNGRGERVHPRKLRREMRVEVRAYAKLAGLTVLPRLLWQGEFVDGIADALITEYAGEPLALTNLNEARTHGALQALEAIHLRGVLHGAIALSNFVAVGDTVKVCSRVLLSRRCSPRESN